jgi:hypothetical protein
MRPQAAGRGVGRVRAVELVRLRAEIKDAKCELLMQVRFANYADDRIMPVFLGFPA